MPSREGETVASVGITSPCHKTSGKPQLVAFSVRTYQWRINTTIGLLLNGGVWAVIPEKVD